MNLIERYIDTVKKYLPEEIREDVGLELNANIVDMLPESYTEDDAFQVLTELGSPRNLADEYNTKKKYLIGPAYYDKYISLLKMVISICAAVALGITLIEWILKAPVDRYEAGVVTELIAGLISSAVVGAMQGAFWVTIVFVILERTGVEIGFTPFKNKVWTPDDLPTISDDKNKISRGETIFSMVMTIVFTALLYLRPDVIAIYVKGDSGSPTVTTLFNLERLQSYLPVIIIFALVQLGVFIWKFITEHRNLPMAITEAAYNVAFLVLMVVMLADQALINEEFFTVLASLMKTTVDTASTWVRTGKRAFGAFVVIICVWDIADTLVRTLKSPKSSRDLK